MPGKSWLGQVCTVRVVTFPRLVKFLDNSQVND
jgi:hypothetical protein